MTIKHKSHTDSANLGRMSHSRSGSPPELLDSTSDLLAALRLNKGMNDLKSDLVLEVPDTPDTRTLAGSGSPSRWRAGRPGHRQSILNCNTTTDLVLTVPDTPDIVVVDTRCKDFGTYIVGGGSTAVNDTERLRKRAKLKRLLSKALDTKASPELPCSKIAKTGDLRQANPSCVSSSSHTSGFWRKNLETPHGETDLGSLLDWDDVEQKHRDEGNATDLITGPQDNVFQMKRCLRTNGSLSRCTIMGTNIQSKVNGRSEIEPVAEETISSYAGTSDQDNRKAVDMCRHYANWNKNAVKKNGRMPSNESLDGNLSGRICITSLDSEAYPVERNKGKHKVDDNTAHVKQCEKAKEAPNRGSSTSDKEVTVISDEDDASRSYEDLGWRTTRNRSRKAQSYSPYQTSGSFKREDINKHLPVQSLGVPKGDKFHVNLVHGRPERVVSQDDLGTSTSQAPSKSAAAGRRNQRRQKLSKGKGIYNSLHLISAECSSSIFKDSDTSYPQSSCEGPNPNATTLNYRHGTVTGPVIDVDGAHSPEVSISSPQERSCGEDHLRQVESDEILARHLQEEFYLESSGPGGMTETDVAIALSLQEEDARRPAAIRRSRSPSDLRNAAMSHLYSDYSSSFQRAYEELANRTRVPTSRIDAQMRRAFNSPELELDRRFDFLQALENAFDDSNDDAPNFNFQTQRDFNENDYEMLLALDDHNHEHVGATEGQINVLPHSVLQSDSTGEACTICLESPTVGDVVRHLPCLHKFHKECIDTWLRRKAACPICKSGIS